MRKRNVRRQALNQLARPVSVALIGPSGIGRVHAREFHRAGAPVTGVLARTPDSAIRAAETLAAEFGTPVQAYESLEEIAAADFDAVSICSPPQLHLEAMDAFLAAGKYVLCEKPLFWRDGLSPTACSDICDRLSKQAAGRLMVNTNNTWFAESWFERHGKPEKIDAFDFHFYTNGPFQDAAIGVDLLPHALSVLIYAVAEGRISNIEKTVSPGRFHCRFDYGGVQCAVDLRQDPDGDRAFGFRMDDVAVERIQKIVGGAYSVFLARPDRPDAAFQIADPFEISINRFVAGVAAARRFDTEMATAARVMTMMTEIIAAPAGTV